MKSCERMRIIHQQCMEDARERAPEGAHEIMEDAHQKCMEDARGRPSGRCAIARDERRRRGLAAWREYACVARARISMRPRARACGEGAR